MKRSTTVPQNRIERSLQSLTLTNQRDRLNRADKSWATQQKPQISSIPGVSPREPKRYQVTWNGEVLGRDLTSDEAFALAKNLRAGKFSQLGVRGGKDAK